MMKRIRKHKLRITPEELREILYNGLLKKEDDLIGEFGLIMNIYVDPNMEYIIINHISADKEI